MKNFEQNNSTKDNVAKRLNAPESGTHVWAAAVVALPSTSRAFKTPAAGAKKCFM